MVDATIRVCRRHGFHRRGLRSEAAVMRFVMVAVVPGLLFVATGCRKDEPSFDVLSLEGRIENIEVTGERTGSVSVLYYNEKQKQDVIGIGLVTPETEIMINGALARLSDLRAGDRVRGEVRVEGKGPQRRQTAIKIRIDRPQGAGSG